MKLNTTATAVQVHRAQEFSAKEEWDEPTLALIRYRSSSAKWTVLYTKVSGECIQKFPRHYQARPCFATTRANSWASTQQNESACEMGVVSADGVKVGEVMAFV